MNYIATPWTCSVPTQWTLLLPEWGNVSQIRIDTVTKKKSMGDLYGRVKRRFPYSTSFQFWIIVHHRRTSLRTSSTRTWRSVGICLVWTLDPSLETLCPSVFAIQNGLDGTFTAVSLTTVWAVKKQVVICHCVDTDPPNYTLAFSSTNLPNCLNQITKMKFYFLPFCFWNIAFR